MAEAHREVIRERLGQAQSISLSMDEREYIKVIRYRCDAPGKPYVHRGILGVMDCGKSAPGDFEEDHALMAVRKLDFFWHAFCSPIGRAGRPLATDLLLEEHICLSNGHRPSVD